MFPSAREVLRMPSRALNCAKGRRTSSAIHTLNVQLHQTLCGWIDSDRETLENGETGRIDSYTADRRH